MREQDDKELAELTPKIEALFPGYKVTARGPGLVLTLWEPMGDGRTRGVDRIELSLMAAQCLLTGRKPERTMRQEWRPARNRGQSEKF